MQTRFTLMAALMMLSLGLSGAAQAAQFVDITYDLSDTTTGFSASGDGASASAILGGSMKIRYASNSASSMPILSGPATLESFQLTANVRLASSYDQFNPFTQATLRMSLVSPVTGSLAGSQLQLGSAQLRVTGTAHCVFTKGDIPSGCLVFGGLITSLPVALSSTTGTGPVTLAGSPGPYGGALSTRHVVTGSMPVPLVPARLGYATFGFAFLTGADVVGREVLREAEGHSPKVIPEPGTLLLLGAGTAGLALVGRATRRSRRI